MSQPYYPPTYRPTDQRSPSWRTGWSAVAWIATLCTLGYLLPWAIATTRGNSNSWGVFWVTLLTGWTILGWIAGLVMAFQRHY